MTAKLKLSQDFVTLVDDRDLERVLAVGSWHAALFEGIPYAGHYQDGRTLLLHRFILNALPGQEVDHANRDTLDNRRSNLRICTRSQNHANRIKKQGTSSQFKGVSLCAWGWRAEVTVNRQRQYLGLFQSEEAAAHAYDLAAQAAFGEFARLNFVAKR